VSWFKSSVNLKNLVEFNIKRYNTLIKKLSKIKKLLFFTQSGCFSLLSKLANDKLIKANKDIEKKLHFILNGENNQRVVIDSPHRTSGIIDEMIQLIKDKILKEQLKMKEKNE